MVNNPKKYWLAITNEYNLEIIKKNSLYATSSESKFKLLNVGDLLVLYLVPKRISGIFKIIKLSTNKKERYFSDRYRYYFEIKPVLYLENPLLINDKWNDFDLIANLSLFKNAKRWGTVLMGKSILEIEKADFRIIKKELIKKQRYEK